MLQEACVPAPREPGPANGFSLVEVMVALAIFGLAAVALIRLQGISLASATTLADRQLAAAVARNQALDAVLLPVPPQSATGQERAGRRDWAWRRQIMPGPAGGTAIIQVDVMGDTSQVIASSRMLWSRR
jgi:general secretion pathway protein I